MANASVKPDFSGEHIESLLRRFKKKWSTKAGTIQQGDRSRSCCSEAAGSDNYSTIFMWTALDLSEAADVIKSGAPLPWLPRNLPSS